MTSLSADEARLGLLGRATRSLAYRAAWRLPGPAAAALVADLIVNGKVHRHLSDRQIARMAQMLAGEDYLASRIVARANGPDATRAAGEQFVARGAVERLSAEHASRLAAAIARRPGLIETLVGQLPPADADRFAFRHLIEAGFAGRLSAAQSRDLSAAFQTRPDFARAVLDRFDDATALDIALGQIVRRLAAAPESDARASLEALELAPDLSARLLDAMTEVEAAQVARLALAKLDDGAAAELALDQIVDRRLTEHLSVRRSDEMAAVFAGHPLLARAVIAALPEALAADFAFETLATHGLAHRLTPAQTDALANELARVPALVGAIAARLSDRDAAELTIDQMLARGLLGRVSLHQADRLSAELAALPTLAHAVFSKLPEGAAADLACAQILTRGLAGRLTFDQAERLAGEFARAPGFAHGILARLPDAEAADLAFASIGERGLLRRLPSERLDRLAGDFMRDPDLGPRLLVAASEADTAAALARTALEHAPPRALERDFAANLPGPAAKRLAGILARHHREAMEHSLREAAPDFALREEAYAQEGEDLILRRMFGDRPSGFYVDVGALHPIRMSNTYLLYRRGWRGINIDATPGSMALFDRLRPRDVNIESLVGADTEEHRYFVFNEPALNTMSESLARERETENPAYRVIGVERLHARPLAHILDEHVANGQQIDLMTIDVEGADLDVLRSNDWARYRPRVLIVELLRTSLDEIADHAITRYLRELGYRPTVKLYNSVFFEPALADEKLAAKSRLTSPAGASL